MKGGSSTGRRPTRSSTPPRRLSPLGTSNICNTSPPQMRGSDAAAHYNYSKYCNYASYYTNPPTSHYKRESVSPNHSPSRRASINGPFLNSYDYIISKRAASNFDRGGGAVAAAVNRRNSAAAFSGYAAMNMCSSSEPYRGTPVCADTYGSTPFNSCNQVSQSCNCIRSSCCSSFGAGVGNVLSKSTENLYGYKRLYNNSSIYDDTSAVQSNVNGISSGYGSLRTSLPVSTLTSYNNNPFKQYNSPAVVAAAAASVSSSISKNSLSASSSSSSSYSDLIGSRLNRLSLRSDSAAGNRRNGSVSKQRSSSASWSNRTGTAISTAVAMAEREQKFLNHRPQSSSGGRTVAASAGRATDDIYGDDREVMVLERMVMPKGSSCLVGLNNEGNTCYLNACLQCLAHTMPLAWAMVSSSGGVAAAAAAAAASILATESTPAHGIYNGRLRPRSIGYNNNDAEDMATSSSGLDGSLRSSLSSGKRGSRERKQEADLVAMEFQELLRNMWSSSSRTYSAASADKFLRRLQLWDTQFSGYNQQDSQEAMRAILDGLHESLNRVRRRRYVDIYKEHELRPEEELAQITWDYHKSINDSVIQDIFCGQLQSTIECSVCRKRSHCFDPFLDLSLPLPEHSRSLLGGKFSSSNKWKVAIQDCLSSFVAPETLTGHDKYRCSTCKVPQPSVKKLSIYRAPPILVLHLKRFHGSGPFSYRKDDTPVFYPLRGLDLSEFIGKKARDQHPKGVLYDLYGVCHHSGSIGYGHYTAQCRDVDGSWYSFNDSTVTPIDETSVISSSAYILFYQLRL